MPQRQSCTGARPLALTDCLNFGNPLRPDIYYQLEECIRGMALASETLDAPVVSGNVSLFNETQGQAVHPTPVVGALGLLDDAAKTVGAGFPAEGLAVMLLGPDGVNAPSDLAGSEYLQVMHGLTAGQPRIDLELERRVQETCRQAISQRSGSLGSRLLRRRAGGGAGRVLHPGRGRAFRGILDAAPAGTLRCSARSSRASSCRLSGRQNAHLLADLARSRGVPLLSLGRTGGDRLVLRVGDEATNDGSNGGPPAIDLPVERISEVWTQSLEAASG